ncbi:MAG: penicillin-binding protein 1C, partial [Merismopedia sp. SIO2A8]|nr:penicillin-binding protein 1C [Merismopedia sp. SIO2A8]
MTPKEISVSVIQQHWWNRYRHSFSIRRYIHPPSIPVLIFSFVLILAIGVAGIIRSLPYLAPIQVTDIAQIDQAVTFRDRHGLPLGTLLSRDQEHTMVVPLEEVAPVFIQAILAAEDGQYYHHGALDLKAIIRATRDSLQAGQIVSGASTITMQLARMLNPTPRTIQGKMGEIWTAWRLAAGMNHDEILAAYINRIPMGSNIYGVEAASQIYFGVSSQDLTLAQASVLAALPNNPTYLNPYIYWEVLQRRQRYVLNRMVAEEWIKAEESDRAFFSDLPLQPRQQGIIAAPHFLFWTAEHLTNDHASEVTTTLDRSLQRFVETQVKQVVRSLQAQSVQQGAAIVIDNHRGEVLAYVGSVDYFSQRLQGQNDGVQALRQPGSTLKPFLYELALEEKRIRPNTILADVPTYYPIPGAKLYSPVDYDNTFQGPVRVRLALANSLNIPAVRVLEQVGVPQFLQRLHTLGFSHLNRSPDDYGLGLALGSGEVTLWELAQAYVTMAHQGQPVPLKQIMTDASTSDHTQISHARSQCANRLSIDSEAPLPTCEIAPEAISAWSLVINMLSDRHARARSFGVDSVLSLPFDAAVKTGTSSNFRDTWTVGFTSDYTVATWIGNFEGEPMHNVSGVTGAAPLWNRIMLHLHEQKIPRPFSPPMGLVKRPICALSGLKPSPTCPSVVEEYFYPADLATYEQQVDTLY